MVLESGAIALDAQPYWINNDEIIFIGFGSPENHGNITSDGLNSGLYIWNIDNNTVRRYRESKKAVCFSDGYVAYKINKEISDQEKKDGVIGFVMKGIYPNEKLTPIIKSNTSKINNTVKNIYTCKNSDRPESMDDQMFLMLREGDGYLHIGPAKGKASQENRFVKLINPDKNINKQLEIARHDYSNPQAYYKFKNAYFIWKTTNINNQWNLSGCRKAWWLFSDGNTESVCIPPMKEMGTGVVRVYPMRSGYLLVSSNFKSTKDSGNAGIYFYDTKSNPRRMIKGLIKNVAISNDGCKVAYVFAKTMAAIPEGARTINMMDVCF